MATAEKRVERRVIEDVTVTLSLSEEEARTLAAVLARVTGSRNGSPREHVAAILDALRRAGVMHPAQSGALTWREISPVDLREPGGLIEGKLNFHDYPAGR